MTIRELCKTIDIHSDGILDIVASKPDDEDWYYTFGFDGLSLSQVVNNPTARDTYFLDGDERYFDCEVKDIECSAYGHKPYLRIEVSVPNGWED